MSSVVLGGMRGVAYLLLCSLACAHGPRRASLEALKSQVGSIWQPMVYAAALANDPTGCRFSTVDRRTVLEFHVDRGGTITDVKVAKSSGVEYLDRVAVDAMGRIGRMNPPPEPDLFHADVVRLPFALTLQGRRATATEKCSNPP
jgi:TonB family protein